MARLDILDTASLVSCFILYHSAQQTGHNAVRNRPKRNMPDWLGGTPI